MKGYEVYRQIREKAEIARVRLDKDRWASPNDLIEYFKKYSRLAVEGDIEKDPRRSVGVLYKDYCALRDELIALLTAETMPSKGGA